jgi:eukaryotic-like serine/threonine-protein kinase
MNASPLLPPGTLLAGKFRIESLLGAGAMGAVYAIHHELTRHKRALKLLHPEARVVPDLVRRFLNEASAAGRAGNAHLVETFDAGTLPTGEPYVVMELLVGETLGARLARERVLDPPVAAEIVAQAAEGIDAAHRVGIVHRDLKPDNLFLTARGGSTFVKVLDFGVSKFVTTTVAQMAGTSAGMVYGSPSYMSPEQLTGQLDVDGRADVFALGVVLFQCLTGELPYDAANIQALTVRMLTERPKAIEELRPNLPPSLVRVVHRALTASRDERLPSARAMMDALASLRPTRLGAPTPISPESASSVPSRQAAGTAAPKAGAAKVTAPGSRLVSWPAGVPRPVQWLTLVLAVCAAILFATLTVLLLRRVGGRAQEAASLRPAATAVPLPEPATLARPSEPARVELPPNPDNRASGAEKSPEPASSSSGSARPSNARNLGLSQDNPFR